MNCVPRYAFAACVALFAPTSGYSQAREVVIGEGSGAPAFQGTAYPCGTNLQQIGREFCAQHSSSGSMTGDFFLTSVSQQPGGVCGWTRYRVECKK